MMEGKGKDRIIRREVFKINSRDEREEIFSQRRNTKGKANGKVRKKSMDLKKG